MAIIYSKSAGVNNAQIGKLETPLKIVIEHESDLLTKQGGIRDWLFNVEKSNKFAETIVGGNEFDTFKATAEGGKAELDGMQETFKKYIEHIQFMKEFIITAEMMEDANYGVAADAKRRAENFTRAYYKTQHKICSAALANAADELKSMTFSNALVDLTVQHDEALFATNHKVGVTGKEQSNIFSSANFTSADAIEESIAEASVEFRNMKDENGEPLGYIADTIILPGNVAKTEHLFKKVFGTEQANGGSSSNYINTQYGNWNIVVLPTWQTTEEKAIIMSSEANKHLSGNMFFNRIPLTINNWVDNSSGNYHWAGRCRFGVGFGSYKHIMLLKSGS